MKKISDFFGKFQIHLASNEEVITVVLQTLKEILHSDFTKEEIHIKNGTLTVIGSPLMKNEIFMKKDLILQSANKLLSPKKQLKNIN